MSGLLQLNFHQFVQDDRHNIGNAYGYRVLAHNFMRAMNGLVEVNVDAKDWVSFVPGNLFVPRIGKRNWIYTMHETEMIPYSQQDGIKFADFVLVPSHWVKENFLTHFPEKDIFVVHPPIDPVFTYKLRRFPKDDEKFRFLYVGAATPRKGIEEISYVYGTVFSSVKNIEFYVKTTNSKGGEVLREGNVIRDDRDLSKTELRDLYHSAHCLLSPSRGEAFNLVLAEAMATGLPCIATNYGGPTDYLNESNGYPIEYFLTDQDGSFIGRKDLEGMKMQIAAPEVGDLIQKMLSVYRDYGEAVKRGVNASATVHHMFDWETAGKRFVETIRAVKELEDGELPRPG